MNSKGKYDIRWSHVVERLERLRFIRSLRAFDRHEDTPIFFHTDEDYEKQEKNIHTALERLWGTKDEKQ